MNAKINLKIEEIISFDSSQYLIIAKTKSEKIIKILTDKKECHCAKKSILKSGNSYRLKITKLNEFKSDGFLVRHIVFIDGKKVLDINEDVYKSDNLIGLCIKK
ncbi:MAG: hypothetical protein ACK5UE_08550 [Chitinophagales bacterium]